MNTDTRCPGCGRANTMDPVGICHACGHGHVDPEDRALREDLGRIERVKTAVLGTPAERFAKSPLAAALAELRAVLPDIVGDAVREAQRPRDAGAPPSEREAPASAAADQPSGAIATSVVRVDARVGAAALKGLAVYYAELVVTRVAAAVEQELGLEAASAVRRDER